MSAITQRIGESVAAVIRTVSLSPVPTKVQLRKRPMFLDGDRAPLILVCVGDTEEFEPLGSSGVKGELTWAVKRPVAVAIAFESGGKVGDNANLRVYRESLWGAVTQMSLAKNGLPEANDVKPAGRPIFSPDGTKGIDWSIIDLTVETLENRNG